MQLTNLCKLIWSSFLTFLVAFLAPEIKTAFGEYEHKLDGSIDFDDDSDGDSRPSLMFGGDFSDGEDDDSEDRFAPEYAGRALKILSVGVACA